jgi:hypothetical protein
MAITGRFEADFASFYEACRQSQVSLKGFEQSTKDVERQVNEMVDSFSGRRVATEATLMADAIGKIGGPSRLTQQELRRVGIVADEAIEKMNRWGEAPPRNLLRVADAARQARSGLSEAAGQIRQVDNVLDLFGVHLGPARKAIDDLGFAAENGAGKLGLVGSAGLTLGAAIGGWQIGRAISEFAGLDEKIGNVAASLLGLPSIAEQSALATADAIALANKAHPELGGLVQSGSTARELNRLDAEAAVAANKAASDVADRVNAVARVAEQIKKVNDEVAAVRSSGVWDDLTKQINSHAVSMSELAKQYHVSDEAMQILAKDATRTADIEANNAKKLADLRDALLKSEVDRQQKKIEADKAAQQALYDSIAAQTAANEAQHQKDIELADAQLAARRRTEETTRALKEQADAAKAAAEAAKVFTQEYDLSTAEGRARFLQQNPQGSIAQGAGADEYFKTHSLADAVRDGLVSFYGGTKGQLPPPPASASGQGPRGAGGQGSGSGGSGFGSPYGSPSAPAGSGYGTGAGYSGSAPQGAAEAPGGGFRAPGYLGSASRPAGVTQIYAPVLVSGVFDPSSRHALGSTVSRAIFDSVSNARVLR